MILKSYKNRASDNKLMFVLSSSNFQQAYRRLQYIKQYANYQKQQSEVIKQEAKQLQELNNDLLRQKKDKQKLVSENKAAKAILDDVTAVSTSLSLERPTLAITFPVDGLKTSENLSLLISTVSPSI